MESLPKQIHVFSNIQGLAVRMRAIVLEVTAPMQGVQVSCGLV